MLFEFLFGRDVSGYCRRDFAIWVVKSGILKFLIQILLRGFYIFIGLYKSQEKIVIPH
uniref:Uncharacterized protein n=1 Tax=Picea sitchensis TaxID=3332 RepID=B8LMV4_PICSI|nr:unknown [Picea sitchensis]